MHDKLERGFVAILLVFAAVTVAAWIHSSVAGYQHTWSDSTNRVCGRLISSRGRLLWQQCDLKPPWGGDSATLARYEVHMPDDFVVGSNPAGERAVIDCGQLAVPFAFPESSVSISLSSNSAANMDAGSRTYWGYAWQERTVTYWFIMAVVILVLAAIGIGWLIRPRSQAALRADTGP